MCYLLKLTAREFAAFFSGVEGRFVFSYIERFEQSWICRVLFKSNGLDFDAVVDFVLAF